MPNFRKKQKNVKEVKKAGGPSPSMVLPLNKKHGQHLLKNPGVLEKIMDAADIKSSDTVFEIGPGTGNMTVQLCQKAKQVIAQEIDPRMAAEVKKRVTQSGKTNLIVKEGDALRAEWPPFHVCAANLPYNISSPFTFKLLAHRPKFRSAVIMFQKEFAERLVSKVGEKSYGRLALNVSLFSKVTTVCTVSRKSFNPPPDVDSMVVKFVPRDPAIEVDFSDWDGMVRICFSRKRKTLHASFNTKCNLKLLEQNYKTYCALTNTIPTKEPFGPYVLNVLKECGVSVQRAITLDLDQYLKLLLEFNKKGIHFSNMMNKDTQNKPSLAKAMEEAAEDDTSDIDME